MTAEARLEGYEAKPVISSYNEWDPLEEVIVGTLEGSSVPPWHITLQATMPPNQWRFFQQSGGKPFPKEQIEAGQKDLEEFVHILEAEGVTVRRPEPVCFSKPYATPDWQSTGGLYAAMPRDLLLVIGDDLIECPMAWRSRYYEINAYRPLLKEYFQRGAKWTAAPKPELSDNLYNYDYTEPEEDEQPSDYVITEFEPTFDAADFIRCGKDIFVQKSHVTNSFGIEWLRRHLQDRYTIHELSVRDSHPMHIDATFMPLAPGKLLLNPERAHQIPPMFRNWDLLYPPQPLIPDSHTLYMTSKWITINVVMLDEERVVVEKSEEELIRAFKSWGFKPIPCNFRNFNTFGGSFHCATLDVRRRGTLQSYF
jgi:glycine amidinotransferase